MAGPKKIGEKLPSLNGWGGVRSVQRRLERSATIVQNREAVAYQLLAMANMKITDIMDWDDEGNVRVKAARLLAKASGLLDAPEDNEKPSVIDVNVVAPRGEG